MSMFSREYLTKFDLFSYHGWWRECFRDDAINFHAENLVFSEHELNSVRHFDARLSYLRKA